MKSIFLIGCGAGLIFLSSCSINGEVSELTSDPSIAASGGFNLISSLDFQGSVPTTSGSTSMTFTHHTAGGTYQRTLSQSTTFNMTWQVGVE
ncbi:MAG: hypothetical protein COT73_00975 [Bdellovibrio sp. CG10_big_fil_rev_8_21_14_0_10_47_8]|nr:MAG: hypothetical protein COT73_00975 [Bdellovibrio sp. CG10_big_fil_rev_8_21_14_0_10_47_8]